MSNLEGELDLIGIDTLFQALTARKATGSLTVRQDTHHIVLAISTQGIRLASGVSRSRSLGELLIKSRKITPAQLEELLAEQRISAKPLGVLVVEKGLLPQAVIESALRKQTAEEIHELFSWKGARFEFTSGSDHVPASPGGGSGVILGANMMALMLDAARRDDELQQIRSMLPDDRLVPILSELPALLDDPALERHVVEEIAPLVDGHRTIEDILQASLHPSFTVLRTLYGLCMERILKIRDRGHQEGSVTVLGRTRSRESHSGPRRGHAILVLSDSPTFRPALALRIYGAGYTVFEGKTSGNMKDVLTRQPADAIIVDVSLESQEGREVCRQLKETARVAYVVITPRTVPETSVHALECGARFVLLKPLDEVRLLERLSQLLPR
jgi:CheY-like chemotaxis protein